MASDVKEQDVPASPPEQTVSPEPASKGLGNAGIASIQGTTDSTDAQKANDYGAGEIIGSPESDAQYWHQQQYDDSCAVVAQEGIIEKHIGNAPSETDLRNEAIENGWMVNEGTKPEDVGKLLEAHDVPVGYQGSGSMEMLQDELAQGHDVIVGVDAGYLWQDPDDIGSGHAVWVTGMETDDAGNVNSVFVNDSGNPDIGGSGRISTETFETAWAAYNYDMVATRDAAR